jgi:putative tryptophan/tyrosine transport system substrate-binding protein
LPAVSPVTDFCFDNAGWKPMGRDSKPEEAMRRRDFIAGIAGSTAAWPRAACAQPPKRLARIGYLRLSPASQSQREENAFRQGLRDLGYVEGQNLQIEYRSTEGDGDRIPALLSELVDLNVDVIVVHADGVFGALRATKTIPIVMAVGPDLVALGLAQSLARPGGNVTGSTFFLAELLAKRLELLKELAPSMTRAGLLLVRRADSANERIGVVAATAMALKVDLHPIEVRGPAEFEHAFAAWADAKVGGVVMGDHSLLTYNTDAIAALVAKHRFPAIGPLSLPENGGLMGYGVNFIEIFRRAAYFVDQILKGVKPGDIPIEQATKFKFVLNLKTANALGLAIPTALLIRADEVIE